MDELGDQARAYELCMGAMTALAIVTDLSCKAGTIDRTALTDLLSAAQEMATGTRGIPLAMFQLLLELLQSRPSAVL